MPRASETPPTTLEANGRQPTGMIPVTIDNQGADFLVTNEGLLLANICTVKYLYTPGYLS